MRDTAIGVLFAGFARTTFTSVPTGLEMTFKLPASEGVKVLENPKTLTLTKAGTGFGTVKGTSGLKCEFLCTSTDVLYQGPVTLPKPKLGKTVVLKATSAPGSAQVEWSGCESNPTPTECLVTMATDREVTATFDELE